MPDTSNDIVIVVRGGCVTEVYTDNPDANIVRIDYDNIEAGDPPGGASWRDGAIADMCGEDMHNYKFAVGVHDEDEQCEVCKGMGFVIVSSGVLDDVIERCDNCKMYSDDIEAANMSGLSYQVFDRETGQPCQATLIYPWELVADDPVAANEIRKKQLEE